MISPPTVVYPGTDLPGTIKFMNSSGEVVETNKFYPGQEYRTQVEMLGLEVGAERSTSLGQNIYLGKCSGEPLVSSQIQINNHNLPPSSHRVHRGPEIFRHRQGVSLASVQL